MALPLTVYEGPVDEVAAPAFWQAPARAPGQPEPAPAQPEPAPAQPAAFALAAPDAAAASQWWSGQQP
eukprot:1978225-Lingulodinium_polyedra.AAC.1